MSFWRDVMIELGGKSLAFAAAVGSATLTGSYWSIVAGSVTFPVGMVAVSYILAPYRPRLTLSELRVFVEFIGWISAAQIFSAISWQSERLLLGKIKSNANLGFFSTANDMASIPMLALFAPITNPLLAAFSQLRDDPARLVRSYQTASAAIIAVGLPVLVGESLVAEPAVFLILGEKWYGVVPLLHWLPISFIPGLFTLPATPLLMSLNKTKVFFRRNLLEFGVKAPLLIIGALNFGFAGVIFARIISQASADLFSVFIVRRLLGLPVRQQLLVAWRSMLSTLLMIPPVVMCVDHIPSHAGVSEAALSLAATVSAGAATYGTSLLILWALAGRPSGIEAMAMKALSNVFNRRRRQA